MNYGFVYAAIAGILPSFVWLWFWLREDNMPEPKFMIALVFLSGIVSVLVAIFAEKYIADLIIDNSWKYTLWAATEEIVKFLAVVIIAYSTKYFDEPIDAMIYCIVAALGFAAIENTLFIFGPFSNGEFAQAIVTSNLRFIGATLVHTVSTATIGFCLGWAFYKGIFTKALSVLVGLIFAIGIHASFNISITNSSSSDALYAFAWIWGAVVILIILFEEIKAVKHKVIT